jgi:hypothetical protein
MPQPVWVMPEVCFLTLASRDFSAACSRLREYLTVTAREAVWKELVGDGPGALRGAMFGGEDVGVTEGLLDLRGNGCAVVAGVLATEPMVETVSPDGVPELVHAVAVEGEELWHRRNAFCVETDFSFGANSGKVAQFEVSDRARELAG